MKDRLIRYFQAAFPGIAIQSTEEARVIADVLAAAKNQNKDVAVWSATEGLQKVLPTLSAVADCEDLLAATRQRLENTVYILRDVETWPFDRDPILTRSFRDLLAWAPSAGSCIVIIGCGFKPQPGFEKLVTIIDYSLPNDEDLKKICAGIAEGCDVKLVVNDDVIRALRGLTTSEAENALALSVIETKSFDPQVVYREKLQAVRRSGLLEIIDPDPRGLDAVGGLDNLKEWILKRRRAFTPEAASFGLPAPKGILLVGVPGTGKSLSAKAIGTALGTPTIKLDVGSLFNSLVGESESRTRDALKLAEAMSPCVLWVDEIEKGLAGAGSGGGGDSGVTKRVFGTIISWMQERRRSVFLVATANEVESLPAEFLRKGRFDEIFAIDLPNDQERREIFAIHLTKKNRVAQTFDLATLVAASRDFTGSEIEATIDAALFDAFDAGRELASADVLAAAKATVPLAVTAKDKIDTVREWGRKRARMASRNTPVATPVSRRRIGNN